MQRLSRWLSTAQPGCRACGQAQVQLPQPHVQVLQDVQAMALRQNLRGTTRLVDYSGSGRQSVQATLQQQHAVPPASYGHV